ncbi:hypothetical protein N431DRAFT_426456 [Stipitochalara longipes BDJ]|nr:hypothetical protein N431DRAFT_426456 [Stipitochalara longipes BDJ]
MQQMREKQEKREIFSRTFRKGWVYTEDLLDAPEYEDREDLDAPTTAPTNSTIQQKPDNLPSTSGAFPTAALPRSNTTLTARPFLTELTIPSLPPTHFPAFISYIYTGATLSFHSISNPHAFATLYLFATHLGSPGLMNHLLTSHRRNVNSWPNPEQVRFIYSSLASFIPLTLPNSSAQSGPEGGSDELSMITEDGKRILKKFTAACIAAKSPFQKLGEGEEWKALLGECGGLALDVLMEGGRWVGEKPWEERSRGEWIVKELC